MAHRIEPPRLAILLVRLARHRVPEGDVEADLLELFAIRAAEHGARRARRGYWRDALSLWRPSHPCRRQIGLSSLRLPEARSMKQDIVFAGRLFLREPVVVALTAIGLGLAIGVATAVFSLLNAAVLRPDALASASGAMQVQRTHPNGMSTVWPYADFVRLREASRTATLEAFIRDAAPLALDSVANELRTAHVHLVSGGYFQTFGGRPAIGRVLQPADDAPSAPLVAVVNHAFWRARLGSDPRIVGRVVYFFGLPVTVVGVVQRGFSGVLNDVPAFWLPLVPAHTVWSYHGPFHPGSHEPVTVLARLAPGLPIEEAQAELTTMAMHGGGGTSRIGETERMAAALVPATGQPGRIRAMTAMVMSLVAVVLMLACVNVANLLLASATAREREIGMRLALGAGRARIARQLATESLLLAAFGGGLGLLAVAWLLPALAAIVEVPPTIDVTPDRPVYVFAAIVSLIAGVGAGLAPVRFGMRGVPLPLLAGDGAAGGERPRSRALHSAFLGAQAAGSIVLLVLAALLTRAAVHVGRADLGFDAERLLVVQVGLAREQYDASRTRAYQDTALERVRTIPGVEDAALVEHPPLGDSRRTMTFQREGHRSVAHVNLTTTGYFRTAGLQLVKGRPYTEAEVRANAPVAVISADLARVLWGSGDPLGGNLEALHRDLAGVHVVGVVSDAITARLSDAYAPSVYRPPAGHPGVASIVVRSADGSAATAAAIRAAVQTIDPTITVRVQAVRASLERQLGQARALATLAGVVSALALALALIGIFGVTTFVVGRRTREVGVRVAVGATVNDVLRLLLRDALRPIVIGLALGLLAAVSGVRLLSDTVYGLSTLDPLAIGSAVVVLLCCASFAAAVPARRAARTDPVTILRRP